MSWEQLAAIEEEGRVIADQEATDPPTACPNDGTPLLAAPNGGLFCRWDGWRYPEDAR